MLRGMLVVGAIVVIGQTSARADGPLVELVTLRDGSLYQGELVEKVVGDHVTVKLADGTVRRFAWSEIQSATESTATTSGELDDGPTVPWPEPERRPPVLTMPHLLLGVAAGLGSPEGYLGLTAGWEPTGWLEVEVAGGLGGNFGPAVAEMVRLGIPAFDARFGIGVGLSQNFTKSSDTALGAPSMSSWLNVETYGDVLLSRHLMLRFTSGYGFLLNSGSFAVLCSGHTRPGDCDDWSIPTSPTMAGGGWAFDLYFSARLAWLFDI